MRVAIVGAAVGRRTAEALESGDLPRYVSWMRAEAASVAAAEGGHPKGQTG